mgnify:CR=1 FL=1
MFALRYRVAAKRERGARMRILITGITGFVGGHLAERLLAEGGHELFGLCRSGKWPKDLAHLTGKATLFSGELASSAAVDVALQQARPEWVFHLAGYANTGKSFREPAVCWADNLDATRTFYDAIVRSELRPRVLFVSSGLIYGDPDEPGKPCDERTTLKPASPYAASKAAADLLGYQYHRTAGLEVLRVRMFNQIGPRQSADYAVPNFARQIAEIEAGKRPPVIETGDLSGHRDISDVRDIVSAFRALIEKGTPGEAYNAGRGRTYPVQELLDRLVRMSRVKVDVRSTDAGRKGDTAVARADTTKLRSATGWEPRYELDQTLADVLEWWRKQ